MLTKTIKNITVTLEGTWYEITNSITSKVEDCGSCEDETPEELNNILNIFIEKHTIKDKSEFNQIFKCVVYNNLAGDYEQIQAIKLYDDNFIIQKYNSDLLFISELETDYKYNHEIKEHLKNYDIVTGFSCSVLIDKRIGDCTNNGISSKYNDLFLVGENIPKIFEVEDIRKCIVLDYYKNYVRCKPVIYKNKWYMAGGNFIYSSDSRFSNINQYPISIHDRIE